MSKSKKAPLESDVQKKIIVALEGAGWYVVKLIQTNKNGINDLIALRDRRHVWIEVKRPGEEPGPLQAFRHRELSKYGAEVIENAQSVDDIKHLTCKK